MNMFSLPFWLLVLQIMAVNIILSGDNAVVIALACRRLPPAQQRWGILFGAGAGVALRILFTVFVTYLLATPFLHIIFGVLLLWIAFSLMQPQDDPNHVPAATSLVQAVRLIVIADIVMSFDNIVAVAAVANGNFVLMIIGLAVSIPMVVYGAKVLIKLLNRFPVIVPGAAALIGFVGGEIMLEDSVWTTWLARHAGGASEVVPLAAAVVVVLAGRIMARRAEAPGGGAVAEEAAEAAALVGLRTLGQLALRLAPMIVMFVGSALGYAEGHRPPDTGAVSGSPLEAIRPIFGAVIAVVVAEALAWLFRRARSGTS